MPDAPWWKNARGEWYFIVQLVLFALILLAPLVPGQPSWPGWAALAARGLGLLVALAGGALGLAGLLNLGPNLSVLPHPKDDATLVEGGAYGLVRHPIYAGLIIGSLGWGLLTNSVLALSLAVGLLVFFDIKAGREERALAARFPGYAAYQKRVRKFFPYIY
jgi:protein-S-isoprenylcysteine O-methyltransferase Ste14